MSLTLRRVVMGDLSWYMTWVNNLETKINSLRNKNITRARQREWLTQAVRERVYVLLDDYGHRVGQVSFSIDRTNYSAQLGTIIIPKYQGRGLSRVAVRAACDYAFNRLGLNKVYCKLLQTNIQMETVVKREGFVLEGTRKDEYMFHTKEGDFHDMDVYYRTARMHKYEPVEDKTTQQDEAVQTNNLLPDVHTRLSMFTRTAGLHDREWCVSINPSGVMCVEVKGDANRRRMQGAVQKAGLSGTVHIQH